MLRSRGKIAWGFGLGMIVGLLVSRSMPPVLLGGGGAAPGGSKPAAEATKKANAAFAAKLPFADKQAFADAQKGFIAPLTDNGVIKNKQGMPVWDLGPFSFIKPDAPAPDTVNLSLWRQARLLSLSGLFQVTDGMYQVRGADLSSITFVEGDSGVTVIDPLISMETAKASLDLYYEHRPKKPVVAVIYTHSHIDHFGGVRGVVSEEDVAAGKVKIFAPQHFTTEAVSENVMAGNAMSRRATYMYGSLLAKGPRGQATSGLGLATSTGTPTLILPTDFITRTGQKVTIDGLTYEFQMAPGTEAPAEMHFFIHELKALTTAENAVHTLHNLYTLRGAKTRNAKAWAFYLNEAIELFGDEAEVLFAPHHWPVWGKDRVVEHLKKMRDTYKYLHDQTLRLANHGYTMTEIAEMIELPDSLNKNWSSRGYYGSVNHDVKAVYNFYLGWFDANPATLHALPQGPASTRYVEYMGGSAAILARARKDFDKGDYRWVAQVVNHLVLAEPENVEARALQADTLEQLGYQDECATWRNFYLTGAQELRGGVKKLAAPKSASADMVKAMPLDLFFDYLGVRLNGPKADGKKLVVNMHFTDTKQQYAVAVENAVLNYSKGKQAPDAHCTVTLTRSDLDAVILGEAKLPQLITAGRVKIDGQAQKLQELLGLLDSFDFWFNIVTPNPMPALKNGTG
jgi:alkyl sulfatase BDS1-like metallo-beta-lactamase superfamily hydrolase